MRNSICLAALALAAGAVTMTTGTSAYAVETCFGLTPTIVTTPGEDTVKGTEGDDVIVDDHGRSIDALGGNDAICSVGSGWISAGEGDDQVLVLEAGKGNFTFLGAGSDVYVGSDARDRVAAGAFDSTEILEGNPGDVDTLSTLGGEDRVHSLTYTYANADVIDLGAGPDSLRMSSGSGGSFAVDGGDGKDHADFEQNNIDADLTLDLATGEAEVGAQAGAGLVGFENAGGYAARGAITIRGSSAENSLYASSPEARLFGQGGNDSLGVDGCGSVARGGGGADELEAGAFGCKREPIALYGGGGRDFLRGSKFRDILIGNAGRDTARGGKGQDRCQAEVKVACER